MPFVWKARTILLFAFAVLAGPAYAQQATPCDPAYPNSQASCPDSVSAYARATVDAKAYLAANPTDAFGRPNQLCPTVQMSSRFGETVWIAGVPNIDQSCANDTGYTNPIFTAWYPDISIFDDGKKNLGPCKQCEASYGDPINGGNGNKYETHVEYSGQGEFPLQFAWTYNSRGPVAISVPRGDLLGGLRKTTFSREVTVTADGNYAFVSRPDGKGAMFIRTGSTWSSIRGDTLIETGIAGEAWIYTDRANNKDYFDADGHLLAMSNATGKRISILHDANGRIESAVDDAGRSLTFLYDAVGRLQTLGLPDGQAIGFTYTAQGYLDKVTYPGGT